jgi:AcrR family transcriptional regulator
MLNEASWAEITMADLAREAEASVGSIYARFPSKAALLDRLDEIYCEEVIARNQSVLNDAGEARFEEALASFVHGLVRYHAANHGLIRTLILETRTTGHPAFHDRSARMNKGLKLVARRLADLAAAEGRKLAADRMAWALFLVLAAMRELTLFPQGLPRPQVSLAKGEAEIMEMALGYLERVEQEK